MSLKKFKIYSSSAGSGKTYTLTREYLKLALGQVDPHYFRHILAITFTNDAANEMKERILGTLRAFAFPDLMQEKELKRAKGLLTEIATELGEKEEIISRRAEKVFHKIIYNYTDFAISTIDKFVNKVVSAFTKELEIPYNYEVDLETDQLLQNAVDRVIDKVGRESKENLSDFLVEWVSNKTREGKNWNRVSDELAEFAKQLMNENAYPYIDQLKALSISDYQILYDQMTGFMESVEQEINNTARKAYDLIQKKKVEDQFWGGSRGSVSVYFNKHREEAQIEKAFLNVNYIVKALEEDIWYTSKKPIAEIDEIKDDLKKAILKIEQIKEEKIAIYALVEAVLKNIFKMALVQEIDTELQEVKRENNTIHISDTNKKIAEIVSTEPVPYIYERVGEKYNHILIDEFQDTSVLQWQNLLPMIENNLAEAHFNLIVGDAKQAIYRWRGGEMEQLVYLYKNMVESLVKIAGDPSPFLEERYENILRNHWPAELGYNFRSFKEIIEFNNDFFSSLVNESDFGQKNSLFRLIYDQTAVQQIPEKHQQGGKVEIRFIQKGSNYQVNMLQETLDLVRELMEEGVAPGEIAILVRSNKNGKELANFLKENQVKVISQDSLLLSSDEKVRFLLAFLKVFHKPDDKLAKSEALYLFYKVVKNEIPPPWLLNEISEIINQPLSAFYEKISSEGYKVNFSRFQELSIYELSEKLIGIFHLLDNQNRLEYIFRFLDILLQFNLQKNSTLSDFLEYWEINHKKLSINSPKEKDAIVITSIHRSKGLEFPVVLLPFADWPFENHRGTPIWVQTGGLHSCFQLPGNEKELKVALLMETEKKMGNTPFAGIYSSETQKTFIENVNLLYVAFTRAVQRLYILPKLGNFDNSSDQKNISYLIFLYLLQKNYWNPEQLRYVLYKGAPIEKTPKKQAQEEFFYVDEFISTDVHKRLKIKKRKGNKTVQSE